VPFPTTKTLSLTLWLDTLSPTAETEPTAVLPANPGDPADSVVPVTFHIDYSDKQLKGEVIILTVAMSSANTSLDFTVTLTSPALGAEPWDLPSCLNYIQ
jgi:hypothetical protein